MTPRSRKRRNLYLPTGRMIAHVVGLVNSLMAFTIACIGVRSPFENRLWSEGWQCSIALPALGEEFHKSAMRRASRGVLPPFLRLHSMQQVTMFSHTLRPPCETGTT